MVERGAKASTAARVTIQLAKNPAYQRGAPPTDADVRVRQRFGWAQAFLLPPEDMAPPQRKQLLGVGVRPRRRGHQRLSRPCQKV
jgi:hypothetical protein